MHTVLRDGVLTVEILYSSQTLESCKQQGDHHLLLKTIILEDLPRTGESSDSLSVKNTLDQLNPIEMKKNALLPSNNEFASERTRLITRKFTNYSPLQAKVSHYALRNKHC